MKTTPGITTVLARGWRGRCPRCGEGALFRRGIDPHDRCSACNLLYQRNHGDTWMFMILTDRIPILFGIVLVYFGFQATTWVHALIFFVLMAVPMILTLRNRQGAALALDYLTRVYMKEDLE